MSTTRLSSPSLRGVGDWQMCPGCRGLLYRKRLERDLGVCAGCGYHTRLTARERIAQLTDPGTFTELTGEAIPGDRAGWDPIGFGGRRTYTESLAAAGERSGEAEAVVFGTAELGGFGLII